MPQSHSSLLHPPSSDTEDSRSRPPSPTSTASSGQIPFPDSSASASASGAPFVGATRPPYSRHSVSGSASVTSSQSLHEALPVQPLPDSLLCRSTFSALEHSAGTLKRLAKNVLASTSAVLAILDQFERAEDDMLASLGELGRWLEGGYSVQGDVWDDSSTGIRKVAREKRRREREELEVMVSHSIQAVKGEVKRQGLAGGGAQAKFESVAKQFYQQTAAYLADASAHAHNEAADAAQASRTAQFDLVRYNHHSTLLYAVPPSSVGCLDLLVGLYGWVGAQLTSVPGKRADTHPTRATDDFASRVQILSGSGGEGPETPTQRGRQLAQSETPIRILSRDDASARGSVDALARTLALSLAHLVQVRGDLLVGWAARDQQTTVLEENVRILSEGSPEGPARLQYPGEDSSPPSGTGKDKSRRRTFGVGGKLRGLFGNSGAPAQSSTPSLAERAPPVSSAQLAQGNKSRYRKSMDARVPTSEPPTPTSTSSHIMPSQPIPIDPGMTESELTPKARRSGQASATLAAPSAFSPPSRPARRGLSAEGSNGGSSGGPRASQDSQRPSNRHSVHVGSRLAYHSAWIPPNEQPPPPPAPLPAGIHKRSSSLQPPQGGNNLSARRTALAETAAKLTGSPIPSPPTPAPAPRGGGHGGVGGLNGEGDEDAQREQVGRKKEGVLWGTGTWEELDKGGGKGKWERFWVVLANSKVYEYRDANAARPESTATVIDLRFASVREARGTDRRFAFEVVTPSHGRRLYQATSEGEMKTWIYVICNAIESCINGTATMHGNELTKYAFNASALLDEAGKRDNKKVDRNAKHKSTPVSRTAQSDAPPLPHTGTETGDQSRPRRSSFKHRLKQGAEAAGDKVEKLSSAVKPASRQSSGGVPAVPEPLVRPAFLAHGGRMPSYSERSLAKKMSSGPPPMGDAASLAPPSSAWFDDSAEGEIERRVFEMAGFGANGAGSALGHGTIKVPSRNGSIAPQDLSTPERFVTPSPVLINDGTLVPTPAAVPLGFAPPMRPPGSPGLLEPEPHRFDMLFLKELADTGANARCADCGRRMKSSRWATLRLREVPMVMFLCIRCCGVHRGLGTHISKPRSVDLDNWPAESIELAYTWGNDRGNAVWERLKPDGLMPGDDEINEFIHAKYVEGRWVADADRPKFGLAPKVVGVAV